MARPRHMFSEYMKASESIARLMFGDEIVDLMKNTPLESFEWDGLDIDTCHILATFPNINERFNESWIEYFEEECTDMNALELFMQVVFHYGYQQCIDENDDAWKKFRKMLDENKNDS